MIILGDNLILGDWFATLLQSRGNLKLFLGIGVEITSSVLSKNLDLIKFSYCNFPVSNRLMQSFTMTFENNVDPLSI